MSSCIQPRHGPILTQWAKKYGAHVIGTVSMQEKAQLALDNGCDDIIVYTRQDFQAAVMAITRGEALTSFSTPSESRPFLRI